MVPAPRVASHPAPEVGSTDRLPDGFVVPDSVTRLQDQPGWQSRVTYARGYGVHATQGKPTALVHSLAVRFRHPCGRAAVAVYEKPVRGGTWTWRSVWIWGADLIWYGGCGVTELREYLAHQHGWSTAELDAWVHGIKARRSEQERAAQEREVRKRSILAAWRNRGPSKAWAPCAACLDRHKIARDHRVELEYVKQLIKSQKGTKEAGG